MEGGGASDSRSDTPLPLPIFSLFYAPLPCPDVEHFSVDQVVSEA